MDAPPLEKRFEAFGARVYTVDGHNCDVLASVANQKPDGRPIVIMARTNPWRGIELLEEKTPRLHFISLNNDDVPRYEEHLNQMSTQL